MSSLVRLQRESKNKVEVITLKSDGYYVGILEHAGFRVRELGITSLVTGIAGAIRLASIIRDVKPDIVQGWMYHGDLLATLGLGLSGRWRRTKLLWGVRCSDMDLNYYDYRLRLAVRACTLISRWPYGAIPRHSPRLSDTL